MTARDRSLKSFMIVALAVLHVETQYFCDKVQHKDNLKGELSSWFQISQYMISGPVFCGLNWILADGHGRGEIAASFQESGD